MPRTQRAAVGGMVYHVLNRGNGRLKVFRRDGDFQALGTALGGQNGTPPLFRGNACREGANELGSLQTFVRLAIRSGKGAEAADFFSKAAEATGVVAAVAAVADLAVHTHCASYCCVLSSNKLRYDPKQDHFIDDWVRYWFNK